LVKPVHSVHFLDGSSSKLELEGPAVAVRYSTLNVWLL